MKRNTFLKSLGLLAAGIVGGKKVFWAAKKSGNRFIFDGDWWYNKTESLPDGSTVYSCNYDEPPQDVVDEFLSKEKLYGSIFRSKDSSYTEWFPVMKKVTN